MKSTTRDLSTILAAGATITYPLTDLVDIYEVRADGGAVILLGNVSINETGTPSRGDSYKLLIFGGFTLGGFTFTVFGATPNRDKFHCTDTISLLVSGQ